MLSTLTSLRLDFVSHSVLIGKVKTRGLNKWMVEWIEKWLKDSGSEGSRQWHRVTVLLIWRSIRNNVLKGSVLGPVLFNIFVNDVEEVIGHSLGKFAHDIEMERMIDIPEGCIEIQ